MENISYLCGSLLGPTQDLKQLEDFIEQIIPEAEEAQRKSTTVKRDFRAIMVDFNKAGRHRYITSAKYSVKISGNSVSRFPTKFL